MNIFTPDRVFARFLLGGACCSCFLAGRAEVRLPSLFSDHMVLQQGVAAPVWGWASPGESVTVTIAHQTKTTTAGRDGKWRVAFDPIKSEQPLELTVRGADVRVVRDVLAGEVWLCSKQSNMVMPVTAARDYEIEWRSAALPLIRMFTVRAGRESKAQADCPGSWVVCSPETVGNFSAVAFYFGRDLQHHRGGAVGLINASAGGTLIESWISLGAQRACEELKPYFALREKLRAPLDSKNPAHASQIATLNVGGLFNGKIPPLTSYALRGIVWYQSESNAHPDRARDGAIVLRFAHANGGLVARNGPLKGFVVAGADRVWKPAAAHIQGDPVVVSAPDVPEPVAARCARASDPVCNLFNSAGLPASPFRTDTWATPTTP